MSTVIALIWKELLSVLYDAKIRIAIVAPPLIQLFVFAFAATLDVKNVPIGVLNRDNGEQGIELVERLIGTRVFNHKITFLKGVEEIASFINRQSGVMVVSIDPSFSRDLDSGKEAPLQLIFDGRKTNTAQILFGYMQSIIEQFNADRAAKVAPIPKKTELVPRVWFNPNLIYFWYNIPCLVVILAMLTCLVVTTQSVARERELGTFDQLLVSPLVPFQILIGKLAPGIVIGLGEGALMLTIGTLVLGVPFNGSLLLYFASLFVFVAAISGVGLFISALSSTQQQAMLGTFVFMLPSVLLSGYATPIENMPAWLQPVTYMIPLRYMLVISKGIFLKAMSARVVWENMWPLIIISAGSLTPARLFF